MKYPRVFFALTLVIAASFTVDGTVYGSENDAVAISNNIQQRHLPYGTILDPVFASPVSDQIVGYTRAADSLIWTGHYLAGESFRSTTFVTNPDQRLSFLIVGRRVNSSRFGSIYETERLLDFSTVGTAIYFDLLDDHSSYFKFNLDTINLYNLIRLEGNFIFRGAYMQVYNVLRRTTDDHGNAHFNMIDRALKGADVRRDTETRDLLWQWLQRPRRDQYRDWRGDPRYPACGDDRACGPIAVVDRVNTDFLWQRSPFLLFGGGLGTIETAGIDYILPYWMARYYGVIQD